MNDQKNTLLAILLSAVVLIVWQYFVGMPQMEKQRQEAAQRAPQQQTQTTPVAPGQQGPLSQPGATPGQTPAAPAAPGQALPTAPGVPAQGATRAAILAQTPRVAIDTPRVRGSISLQGARIDDLALVQYRETVNPNSPPITLLSPSGSAHPFYAESGFVPTAGANTKLPTPETRWRQVGAGALGVGRPVTLAWDNDEGLEFRRTIAVDENYLFTVEQKVINKGTAPVTVYPYALLSRHGTPKIEGYYISHEGMIGIGERLEEYSYSALEDKKAVEFKLGDGWFGITDKYWAATWIPQKSPLAQAHFKFFTLGNVKAYQADYLGEAKVAPPGGEVAVTNRLFAGAKEVAVIDHYQNTLGADRFDRLIDWGWFYFITKPMFTVLDYFFRLFGNFGLAILMVTVLIKIVFFPLANKSYASMAKMKAVQPQMMAIRDRYADDKVKQQQALMELYKQEKINPLAGCLPIVIQIPVFFALYKVLFVTLEMRHAPFFGWIKDLSAPDPTTVFNLFGLIPWDPSVVPVLGPFLMLGVWPLIMGVTMWVQMKLNPSPPDPTQKMIFDWMPLIFTFMLASFSAGLVIYWAWNNTLSIIQQTAIMRKNGAKIELWDNLKSVFVKPKGG